MPVRPQTFPPWFGKPMNSVRLATIIANLKARRR